VLRNGIKSILSMRGKHLYEYAEALNIRGTTLSAKLQNSSFSFRDLETLAGLTGTCLCLVDRETKDIVVKLSSEDPE